MTSSNPRGLDSFSDALHEVNTRHRVYGSYEASRPAARAAERARPLHVALARTFSTPLIDSA